METHPDVWIGTCTLQLPVLPKVPPPCKQTPITLFAERNPCCSSYGVPGPQVAARIKLREVEMDASHSRPSVAQAEPETRGRCWPCRDRPVREGSQARVRHSTCPARSSPQPTSTAERVADEVSAPGVLPRPAPTPPAVSHS